MPYWNRGSFVTLLRGLSTQGNYMKIDGDSQIDLASTTSGGYGKFAPKPISLVKV